MPQPEVLSDMPLDKRQQLITTAFKLFYFQSVHGVGINQILQESVIAKKTLYHHFASKDELVEAVVLYRDQVFYHWLSERVLAVEIGKAGIRALFMALDDWFNQRVPQLCEFRGCFFINVSAEFTDASHPVHRLCAEHKQRVADLIAQQVAALGLSEAKAAYLVDTLCLLKEGAIVSAQLRGDTGAAMQALKVVEQLIEIETH